MIRAILYDLGDIFFEAHYWRRWMHDRLSASGEFTGDFRDFYAAYEKALEPVYEGRIDYGEAYRAFIVALGVPNPAEFIERSLNVKRFYEDNRELFPTVRYTLERLHHNGIRQAVISDNECSGQDLRHRILERFGLNRYLDTVITSLDVGCRKPDPRIYMKALSELDCPPDKAVFVGHDLDELRGATDTGITAVEFNNYLGYHTPADNRIERFSDLLELVGAMSTDRTTKTPDTVTRSEG